MNSLETVMVKLVVRSQSRQGPHPNTVCKEDLRGSINPCRAFKKLAPVYMDIISKAVNGTLESESTEEENEHDKVREQSGEPDDLARGVETFSNDQVNTNPGKEKTSRKLPLNSSKTVFNTKIFLENTMTRRENV